MIALSLLALLLAPAALAGPWRRDAGNGFQGLCHDSQSDFPIPSGLDPLTGPPNLVLVGVGVQNYTCNANGTFDNVGAVAQLFDISCLDGTVEFSTIQCASLGAWSALTNTDPLDGALAQAMKTELNLTVTGQHFFQKTSGPPVPVWDLRADPPFQNNPNAFVVAKKLKSVPSPDGASDVAWLELAKVSGELANTIYRINTEEGQPAASCKPGDTSSVKYSSKYLLL